MSCGLARLYRLQLSAFEGEKKNKKGDENE